MKRRLWARVLVAGAIFIAGFLADVAKADPSWSKTLPFTGIRQEQSNWCWASNIQMVRRFYNSKFKDEVQCWLADRAKQAPSGYCCNTTRGAQPICNRGDWPHSWGTPDVAWNWKTGFFPFGTVATELNANRPMVAYIAWTGGGAHVVVLYGASLVQGGAYKSVTIYDPGRNDTRVFTYANAENYDGGKITNYYTTSKLQ